MDNNQMDDNKMKFQELTKKLNRIEENIIRIDNELSSLKGDFATLTNTFNSKQKAVSRNQRLNKTVETNPNSSISFSSDGMGVIVVLMIIGIISAVIYLSIQ